MEEEEYLDDSKKVEVKGVETAPIAEEVIQPVEDIVVDIEEPKKTKTTNTKDVTKPIIDTTSAVEEEVQTKDIFDDLRKKPFPAAMEFSTPKTSQEAFSRQLGSRAAAPTTSTIKGFTGIVDYDALQEIYAPVDLAAGIPDPQERESFIASNGSKMVKLFNENDFGVKFESDLSDLAKYKEKQYPLAVKKFIDDLDANQGWMAESMLTFTKFIGKIAVGVPATMLASIYGAGSALVNWDSRKFYDNAVMDAAEFLDQSVDKYTAIYGGSDVFDFEINPDTGIYEFKQKDFLARMASDPLKSINADVVPAAAFIADMVISESAYGALTAATGGLATGGLALNTARLANKAKQLSGWATRTGQYSKANRILRGIDKVDDVKAAADIAEKTQRYRSAFGTIGSMYRSSAYESALIARDTDKHTLELLISQHKEREGTEPTKLDLARYKDLAKSAGEQAYGLNAILVGGSNLIQFPRLLTKNYKVASSRKGVFDSLKLGGTQFKNGKHIANVDAKKYLKTLGYAKSAIKGGITEGFEELSQGALEEGLVDYFASKYSEDSNRNALELINAVTNKASTYLNTVEGRDSVTIGAMMGMLGIRVPFVKKSDSKLGFSLTTKGFGGARQEIQETRKKIDEARSNAERLNSDLNFNPVLSATFENSMRHIQSQKNMDAAANNGDTYRYKNSEFDSLFSLVHKRTKLGLEDTIAQELDGALEIPIEKFNETYATKGVENYTEETRAQAVESAKNTAAKMVDSIKSVEALLENKKPDLLTRAAEEAWLAVTGKEAKTTLDLSQVEQGIKDQMVYLHAAVENTSKREAELLEQIKEKTNHSFPLSTLDRLLTQVSGVKIENGKLTFSNRAQQVKEEVLKEYKNLLESYKEEDPVNYNMNVAEVSDLLDDVLKLKIRRGEASRMYRELFTEKGSKAFADFAVALSIAADKNRNKIAKEDIIKKEVQESRNATLARQQKNELSVSGNTDIVDAKINSDTVNGIKEIQAREEDPTNSDEDLVDGMLKTLDNYPGLLTLVKERLEDRGVPTEGIAVAAQIQLRDSDGTMLSNFFKEIAILKKEVKAMEDAIGDTFKADTADQLGQVQSKDGEPVLDKDVIESDVSEALSKGKQVTENLTIINTFDKKIEGGKTVKGEDGKAVKHSVNKQYYPLDANKVNDPDFLNNLELTSEKHNFTFRVQKDNPYNNTASVENMAIEVVYVDPVTQEETFISRLPAYKKGMPKQLLELREEVLKRSEVTEDVSEDNVKRIQEIKARKKEIKKELKEKPKTPALEPIISTNELALKQEKTALEEEQKLDSPNKEIIAGHKIRIKELEKIIKEEANKNILNSRYLQEFGIKWEDKPFPGDIIEYNSSYYKVDYSENQRLTGNEILNLAEDGLIEYTGVAEVFKNETFDLSPWNIKKNKADVNEDHPTGPLFSVPLEKLIDRLEFTKIKKGEESTSINTFYEEATIVEPIQQTSEVVAEEVETDVFKEASDFVIEGIQDGWRHLKGDKANGVGDLRGKREFTKHMATNYYRENVKGDKKIFTYVAKNYGKFGGLSFKEYADAGRDGYFTVSIAVPINSTAKLNDFKDALESKADEIRRYSMREENPKRNRIYLPPSLSLAKPKAKISKVETQKLTLRQKLTLQQKNINIVKEALDNMVESDVFDSFGDQDGQKGVYVERSPSNPERHGSGSQALDLRNLRDDKGDKTVAADVKQDENGNWFVGFGVMGSAYGSRDTSNGIYFKFNSKQEAKAARAIVEKISKKVIKPYVKSRETDGYDITNWLENRDSIRAEITQKLKEYVTKAASEFDDDGLPAYYKPTQQTTEVEVKPGVPEVFNNNTELSKIGTEQEYSKYLNSVFPDSKVKNIVYRGDNSDNYSKKRGVFGEGIYLTESKSLAEFHANKKGGEVKQAIVDFRNPNTNYYYHPDFKNKEGYKSTSEGVSLNKNEDSVVGLTARSTGEVLEYVALEPKQVHVLGSKKDIKGFRDFVNQPPQQISEVVDNKKELAEELNSLTKELKELMGDISPQINLKEESVFEYISDLTLIEDTKLKNSKEAELKKNFGEDNVERANAINANFDTIIEEINKSGINIFFDPKTNKHQNGCD